MPWPESPSRLRNHASELIDSNCGSILCLTGFMSRLIVHHFRNRQVHVALPQQMHHCYYSEGIDASAFKSRLQNSMLILSSKAVWHETDGQRLSTYWLPRMYYSSVRRHRQSPDFFGFVHFVSSPLNPSRVVVNCGRLTKVQEPFTPIKALEIFEFEYRLIH